MTGSVNQRELAYQAEMIEQVLASHRVEAVVEGGVVGPRLVKYRLLPALGTKISQVARLSEELAMALGSATCRVVRRGGYVNVEVPRERPGKVELVRLCRKLAEHPKGTAALGMDEDGTPLLLRLGSPEVAHAMVSGMTGSGKTALTRSMALSLAMENGLGEVGMMMVDPKGNGYGCFRGLPHLVWEVVTEAGEALAALRWLVGEMERRSVEGVEAPMLVAFVDELADLMMVGGKEMEEMVTRLVARGRGAGVHVVASTQKPTAAAVGSLVKANFPVRLVGKVGSATDARVASGVSGTGAERLMGRGDFLLVAGGQVERFQGAWVSEGEVREVVEQLRGGLRGERELKGEGGWRRAVRRRLSVVV